MKVTAFFASEERVLALWDDGERDHAVIAEKAGVSPVSVDAIIRRLCYGNGPDSAHVLAMKLGSEALLKAIAAERGLATSTSSGAA